jgi:glycosyltransferase 2 family protein
MAASAMRRAANVLAPLAFFVLVGFLLVTQLREVQWSGVLSQLRAYPSDLLLGVGLLSATSYLVYSLYDLVGRHQLRHGLARLRVMAIAFVSYAFNLNLGALVGGFAFRYRLYARAGLKPAQTTQVLGLSLVTNWLGYLALAGGIFASGSIGLPASWNISDKTLPLIGGLLLLAATTYLLLCAFSRQRSWILRGHELRLPSWTVALTQLSLSLTNWLLIGSMLYLLLGQQVPFAMVLGVLMLSAIAGVITHIPAGLGVIEAVFLALLGGVVAPDELLAALLAYRGVYYLLPLMVAALVYLLLEAQVTHARAKAGDATSRA